MNNGSVYEKIIEKANQEAFSIISEGKIKANNITEQKLNETNFKISQVILDTKAKCENQILVSTASIEQMKSQKILNHKKRLIKESFDKVLEQLVQLNDEELTKYVINNLNKSKLVGQEKILVNDSDFIRYNNLFSSKKDNHLDKLFNNKYELLLEKTNKNILGGFIVETLYYDIDYTYEVVLGELEELIEAEVSKMLFDKGE